LCQVFPDSVQLVAWNSFKQANPGNWAIRWDKKTGVPASIYLGKTKPYSGNPQQIAQIFLKENSALTKMKADVSNLKLLRVLAHYNISDVTFQETYNGMPVEGAEYQVHIEADGCVDMANGTYYPSIDAPPTAQLTGDVAITNAKNDIGNAAVIAGEPGSDLVVFPDSGQFYLAWKVSIATQLPNGAWTYFVDAITGKILSKSSDICFLSGQGKVYPTNPNLSSVSIVTLSRLDNSGYLEGNYANILNNVSSRAYSSYFVFYYDPTDTRFDEVNLYWHIDLYRGVYLANLGFTAITQMTATAHVDNIYPGPNNAWFNPSTHQLYFGDGTPSQGYYDFAKEDKVIYHEYTHAMTLSISGISGAPSNETGAINEGNSDYFAGSYTGRSIIGDYAYPNNFPRDMNNPRIPNYTDYNNPNYYIYNGYNYGYQEPHFGSELWSASLWDLHNNSSVGAAAADRLVYGGLHRISPGATFLSYRDAIIVEDQADYAGLHLSSIEHLFYLRGIGVDCLQMTINGPTDLGFKQLGTWTANTSGGSGNNSYQWYVSSDGGSTWITLGTSQSQSRTMVYSNFIMRCNVYDNTLVTNGSGSLTVYYSNGGADVFITQNYPNPFNPTTTLSYQIPTNGHVTIKIFDIIGREVTTLVDEFKPSGHYSVQFDASHLASGIYFYSIKSGDYNVVKKMSLIK
jgi:Zn-dependent metalloprotease